MLRKKRLKRLFMDPFPGLRTRAAKIAQRVRILTTLTEDLGWALSTGVAVYDYLKLQFYSL